MTAEYEIALQLAGSSHISASHLFLAPACEASSQYHSGTCVFRSLPMHSR